MLDRYSYIKSIKISNFKTFKKEIFLLNNFNIFIGKNASGKTNFVKFLKFLQDVSYRGLDEAIKENGNIRSITNSQIGFTENIEIELLLNTNYPYLQYELGYDKAKLMKVSSIFYKLSIKPLLDSNKYEIIEDKLIFDLELVTVNEPQDNSYPDRWRIIHNKDHEIVRFVAKENKTVIIKLENNFYKLSSNTKDNIHIPSLLTGQFFSCGPSKMSTDKSILYYWKGVSLMSFHAPLLGDLKLYDTQFNISTIENEIENSFSSRAVLKNILEINENKYRYLLFLQDILPFIEDIKISKENQILKICIKEKYNDKIFFYENDISDGTINIIILVVILYFHSSLITILEEPEKGLHPHLMKKMIEMVKDASKFKQIIITTHNPQILDFIDVNNLFLIHRDDNGFSHVTKPTDMDLVKEFLKTDSPISELFKNDLLEPDL